MKKIHLANNKGIALVDDEDYEMLIKYKWHLSINKYASTNIKINNEWKQKSMHRLIMKEPIGLQIDHINHDGLNNQKNNLRIVINSQNQMNKQKRENCSSKFKGVYWHKGIKKWTSSICVNKKRSHLGYFKNEEEAAIAYNKKANEFFGEYAYLNEV